MIKILDPKGEPMEVTEKLWESLSAMKNCKYRLAEVPIPKEVVEFKPTPAKQPTEIDKIIEEKICSGKCEHKEVVIPDPEIIEIPQPEIVKQVSKPQNKGGRPKKK